jgi:pyruvyl transferase EpsO
MIDHAAARRQFSEQIEQTLRDLIPAGTRIALVDYPDYPNVGDSLIWLGTRICLQRLKASVVYTCSMQSYRREDLAQQIADSGLILISGGGNFGDVWPKHQLFREQIMADFPNVAIVQLPQAIYFQDPANLQRAQLRLNQHAHFTLLVRDQVSLNRAKQYFEVPSHLCPDMAMAIGAVPRQSAPSVDILWIARNDKESRFPPPTGIPGFRAADWNPSKSPGNMDLEQSVLCKVHHGCHVVGMGRVVITDRLHGHILCLQSGLPHVVLDNTYGKNRNFIDTWTGGHEFVHWADTPSQALELARALLH